MQALPTREGQPGSPYRCVEGIEELSTTPFPGTDTLDDLFARAVRVYNVGDCLGTRELLSEHDEVQPNGKVFKKVSHTRHGIS